MLTPSITRKLTQPGLPSTILHRLPLLQLLERTLVGTTTSGMANICKLVLLCTPAGYGKTTLLADFAKQSGFPCCWYNLDRSDADPCQFIHLLIKSLCYRFPQCEADLGPQIEQLIADELHTHGHDQQFKKLIDTIITAIQEHIPERFAIFLCNYHEVNDNALINTFMNTFLQQLSDQCVVVIESRAIPSIDLASLLAWRQLLGIGSNLLRFNAQDIQELVQLQQISSISEEEATYLTKSFNGWIAGILLGTRLGDIQPFQQSPPTDAPWGSPAIRTDKQNLFAYLVNEVFKREADIYTFLKDASILEQMTPLLCNAILDITDAEQRLIYVEQKGLFVTRSDDASGNPYYTFHPLLRELLYEEACRQNSMRVQSLHRRAADIFFKMQDYDQAIHHALAAQAYDLAAHFIEQVVSQLQLNHYPETLATWIDMLPSTTLERSARLLQTRASMYLRKSEWIQAQEMLEKAYNLVVNTTDQTGASRLLLADILIAQSRTKFNAGEYLKAQELCEQALELLPENECVLRAKAYHNLGQIAIMLGDCPTGLVQMQHALQLWGHNTEIRETAILHGNLANVYSMLGNYTLAEHHSRRATAACDHLGDIRGKINNMIGMAITIRNKGDLEEAVAKLLEGLAMAREVGFISGEAYALENLGEVYQDQGHLEQSLKALEDCLALASQMKDTMLINNALCTLSMTYLLMGDPQTAIFLVNQTEVKTDDTRSYERMICELTRGTIYLYQHQYQLAYPHLSTIAVSLQKAGLKSRYIRTLIRLAACQIGLKKESDTIQSMEQVVREIKHYNHEHIATIEFLRLPELVQAIQTMPEAARLESWLIQPLPTMQNDSGPLPVLAQTHEEDRSLRIYAFGEPTVLINGCPISHWRMARSVELYFYLLNAHGSIRKEQIIDALWPEPEENIDQTFRSTIYYLRKAIGEACIIYRSGKYTLDHSTLYGQQVWYDVELFQRKYVSAKSFLTQGNEEEARKDFQEMVELYRGDYVQAFYSDWCIPRRDELRHTYMLARQGLATIAWNNERLDECILHWQQLLAIDSCLEEAHYNLMRCYLRQGKRNLALRQYQRCVDIFQKELSVTPGPTIQKLYQRLTGSST